MADIRLILAPFHAGAAAIEVGAGPQRLLDDGLEQALKQAGHATVRRLVPSLDGFEGEIGRTFEVKRRVAAAVAEARRDGAFPIVLAGNCNTSVGVWAGLADEAAGLFWFDAHPDFDTPDEHRSGYFDGMGVATLAGQCWRSLRETIPGYRPLDLSHLLYCGIRDFEPGQLEKVEAFGIKAVVGVPGEATDYAPRFQAALASLPFKRAMIHLDVDCLDPSVGIANRYAAPGGLSADQLRACLRSACDAVRPVSLTIASFDPRFEGAERISAAAIAAALLVASYAK